MEAASLRLRVLWLAASFVVLTAIPWPLAAQQPAVNPSPPVQPAVSPSAQPGAGPGSQPLVSPPGPAAQSAQPQPPPSWQQGRPEGEGAAMLAPVPALPIATAVDKLPATKLKLPKKFNIEIYAAGLTNARSLRVDDKGNVFVSTRVLDRIYAITDKNGKKAVKTLSPRQTGSALPDRGRTRWAQPRLVCAQPPSDARPRDRQRRRRYCCC